VSFEQSASYVKATGGSNRIDLPVVDMEVMAEPIVPDGGTAQMDYDERAWFELPNFRLKIELTYPFERTDYMPDFQNSVRDLIAEYMDGNGPLDLYVKYTGPTDQYDSSAYDPDFVCPDMIPDMSEEDAGIVFSDQAREKERTVNLISKSSSLTWDKVKFTFD